MSLDELAAVAFSQGCGVSLGYARRTPRYRELLDEARLLGLNEPEDSALATLLGERLADRAFRNLPPIIRNSVAMWQKGVDAQMQVMELLCTHLDGFKWRRGNRGDHEYNSDIRSVLPHGMQSWYRGVVMPNCLGVAQMLVGFARAIGAPHYLANIVRSFDQEKVSWEVRSLRAILEIAATLPNRNNKMRKVVGQLHKAYEQALDKSDECHNAEAHHVLVVQLADGVWWVVDPYLSTHYSLGGDPKRDTILPMLHSTRNDVLLLECNDSKPAYVNRLERRFQALEYMYMVIDSRFKLDKTVESIVLPIAAIISYLEICELPQSGDELLPQLFTLATSGPDDIIGSELGEKFEDMIVAVMTVATCPGLEDPFSDPNESKVVSKLNRSRRNMVLQQRIVWRMVAIYLDGFIEDLEKLYSDETPREHERLEIASPSLMLGVATLNHLRSRIPVRLGGLLSVLSTSQWVLADTLAAEHKGDAIRPEYEKAILERLDALRIEPASALVPPLHHLTY